MKGLESLFANTFHAEATKRGFTVLDQRPAFGANPLYKTDKWLICSMMKTMFPDTTVTITLTPQNPPPDSGKQHLLKCEATWLPTQERWELTGREYTTDELIEHAFNQMHD